jgi:NAD dependent epimerase/dehydratase family enzyme
MLRTGLVLGDKGALTPLRLLTLACVSGPLAGGKAWWPWISLNDEARAIIHLITSTVSGPVNLVGPQAATSGTLLRTLAVLLKRPYWLPAPRFALSALLGEGGREVMLSSQKVVPQVLLADGFAFKEPTVGQALAAAIGAQGF